MFDINRIRRSTFFGLGIRGRVDFTAWSFAIKQKFLKPNASEWSCWSVMSVFAGNSPTQTLILMENLD